MVIFKKVIFILIEKVINVNSIVVPHIVLLDKQFMYLLSHYKQDNDAGQREKRHLPSEHELIVHEEVGNVEGNIHYAKLDEGLILTKLVELKNFFQYVQLSEKRLVFKVFRAHNLDKLVEGRVPKYFEFFAKILYMHLTLL